MLAAALIDETLDMKDPVDVFVRVSVVNKWDVLGAGGHIAVLFVASPTCMTLHEHGFNNDT